MNIVEMLRMCNDNISNEAADEILRLRVVNAKLVTAVKTSEALVIRVGSNGLIKLVQDAIADAEKQA